MKVTLKGTKQLRAKLNRGLYAAPVSRFLRRTGYVIMGNVMDEAPRFDGALANSIAVEVDRSAPQRWVRVQTDKEYAPAVELGRKPGKRPPIDAIKPWAEAHGIPPAALAISIGRKGTKAHPFMRTGLEASKDDIRRLLIDLSNDIERSNALK